MTLADLISSRFETVEPTDDGVLVHCPAHNDSRPSLRLAVSAEGRVLMRCRAGCETADVVAALGLTMRDLATMKPGAVDFEPTTSRDVAASPADVAALAVKLDKAAARWDTDEAADVRAYAFERFGITAEDGRRLGLGRATDPDGTVRLVVPFRDEEGVARGFQARALDKHARVRWLGPRNPEGASWTKVAFFPGSSGWDEVLICEGPGDALTGVALGYDTIGIRGAGLAANPVVVDQVADILGDREAVIAGDGDPSGRRFSAQLAEALSERGKRVRVLDLPDDMDLTDWRAEDPAGFSRDVIRRIAQAAPVKGVRAALLAWDEDRYSLTDLGGARYLRDYIRSIGSGVRYTAEAGFFLLEDGVWRADDTQRVRTHAQAVADIVKNLAREASVAAKQDGASEADKHRASRFQSYAKHAQTTRGLDSMIRELQAVDGVPARMDQFDQHPDLLAVRNGVINLRTGELMPHDPALLLTRRLDLNYDPNAKAPRWEQFLSEVFPDYPDLPGYMQRLVGYGITGHTDEQCFVVHWGNGANGKSVFTDTLSTVFDEHTATTPFSTFEEKPSGGIPNDLAALRGARLVMASEGEQGRPMAESVIKRVTGRDRIAARFMRREFFTFRPSFLLMLASNFKPAFRGQDDGLWRRVKLIPWERFFKPEERDHRLGDKLLAEREGILAWAVAGAVEWYARGLQDPQVVKDATKEYRETSDALAGFLPGVFVYDDTAARMSGKTLFDAYLAWAEEENLPAREVWTRRAFFGAMEERGLTKRKTNTGVAFDGIRRAKASDNSAEDHTKPSPLEVPTCAEAAAGTASYVDHPDTDDDTVAAPSEPPALQGADLDDFM